MPNALSQAADSEIFQPLPARTERLALDFAAIEGWAEDDHRAAFTTFLKSCAAIRDGRAALRDALTPPDALRRACAAALALSEDGSPDPAGARRFFEAHFVPYEIRTEGRPGFLTAYYEPEIEASLIQNAAFPVPVLARPADLVTLRQGETAPGLEPGLQAGRRTERGLEPFPDRSAIWAGALEGQKLEIAWLRDHAELFITQVQGSARLKLTDGRIARLVYSGRNGHAYTSVGRKIVESGAMALEEMTLEKLMTYLRADSVRGRALMEQNRSYVFFALEFDAPAGRGPTGGAGLPLTAGRSLAIDRAIWPYGLPVFVDVNPLVPEGGRQRIARLMIAEDTGSAIVGPARGDYFMGSGAAAGTRAGLVRDSMRFIVLAPKAGQ